MLNNKERYNCRVKRKENIKCSICRGWGEKPYGVLRTDGFFITCNYCLGTGTVPIPIIELI